MCSFKVFLVAGIIGMFVIVPVNYRGDQIEQFNLFNITNQSLDKFSISNLNDGSNWYYNSFSRVLLRFSVSIPTFKRL